MMEALRSSETSIITMATSRNIPKDAIVHSHRRENLKSYTDEMNLYNSVTFSDFEPATFQLVA
jgi:hypothetical protein